MPDGDADFAEFVAARRVVLFRAAVLLTGDVHLAEDLVQATFVKVWTRWRSISAMENVDAYVRRVLVSVFLSWRRRLSWGEAAIGTLPETTSGDSLAGIDDHLVLIDALRQLPPRQRTVIALRYLLDASEADTAAAMRCSVGTVKRQAHSALEKLRALLAEQPTASSRERDAR